MSRLTLLAMALAGLLTAQDARIAGPTPGFVFDSEARQMRPVRGVVGAGAYLGAALIADADAASVSPDGRLAVTSRSGVLELARDFDSESPESVSLGTAPQGALLFAWSGHDLAVLASATRKALVWRDLDSTPRIDTTIDLSFIDGEIAALLFDGERLAVAAKGGLYLASPDRVGLVLKMADPAALISNGGDLYVADRAREEIWQVLNYAAGARPLLFAEIADPVGLQVSRHRLLIASGEGRTITAIDLVSRARIASLELEFRPTRLDPLGTAALALLNRLSPDEPLYVLDSGESMAVYFVPGGREQ